MPAPTLAALQRDLEQRLAHLSRTDAELREDLTALHAVAAAYATAQHGAEEAPVRLEEAIGTLWRKNPKGLLPGTLNAYAARLKRAFSRYSNSGPEGHTFRHPFREDFNATLVLPPNPTARETARLADFVRTLGLPDKPETASEDTQGSATDASHTAPIPHPDLP